MSTCVTFGTATPNFVDGHEVKKVAVVVVVRDGLAHSCPGCPVAETAIGEDDEPATGKGCASCEGIDAMATVMGSTA